ncbi:MAG TPA: divergent polysaccharide deacetylase family protein [Gammaproteobacteria bacterium]
MAERRLAWRLLLLGLLLAGPLHAGPVVSLILDDLGDRGDVVAAVVALPAAVALAVLPQRPHGPRVARLGAAAGHEILLHLPLEASGGQPLGPGGLTAAQDRAGFEARLRANLDGLPQVSGVNNHMGSRLTREVEPMRWLMAELRRRDGLYFVDSRTTHETVALQAAAEYDLPRTARDHFLDNEIEAGAIRAALLDWVREAHSRGSALAIAHPHAETLAVLEEMLPRLDALGVRLVPVSELIARRGTAGWRVSSAPTPD